MPNIFIQDLAQYLQSNGLGTIDTDLFIGRSLDDPTLPSAVTILSEVDGQPSSRFVQDTARNVQVIVRSAVRDYVGGSQKIWAIYNLLSDPENRVIIFPSGRKASIRQVPSQQASIQPENNQGLKQTPGKLQDDSSFRSIFIVNLSIWTKPDP